MSNEKTGCGAGCLILLIILLIISGIMTCSNKTKASAAVKAYKSGNIEKALEIFNKIDFTSDMNSVQLYYFAQTLDSKDSKKAKKIREQCYDKLIEKESEVKKFKKEFGDVFYNNLYEKERFSLRKSLVDGQSFALKAAEELIKAGDVYDNFIIGENSVVVYGIQGGKRCYLTRTKVTVKGTKNWFVCKMSLDSNNEAHFEYTKNYLDEPTFEFLTYFGW